MNPFKSVVVVPVNPKTKAYIFSKYSDLIIDNRYFDLRKPKYLRGISYIFGLLVNSRMEKYCPNYKDPQKEYLEILLGQKYEQFGITKKDSEIIGRIFDQLVLSELSIYVQNMSILPLMNKSEVIRMVFNFFNISEEIYDTSSLRRYVDRYSINILGKDYITYKSKINAFIIKFYLENLEKYAKNPKKIKERIEQLKLSIEK